MMEEYNIYAGLPELGGRRFLYTELLQSQDEATEIARTEALYLYHARHDHREIRKEIAKQYMEQNHLTELSDYDEEEIDDMLEDLIEYSISYKAIPTREDENYSCV